MQMTGGVSNRRLGHAGIAAPSEKTRYSRLYKQMIVFTEYSLLTCDFITIDEHTKWDTSRICAALRRSCSSFADALGRLTFTGISPESS